MGGWVGGWVCVCIRVCVYVGVRACIRRLPACVKSNSYNVQGLIGHLTACSPKSFIQIGWQ